MSTDLSKGKFIVLYGINNLGKSTQAKLLVKRLEKEGYQSNYLKYPIYTLKPTGPKINQVLRSTSQNLSEMDFQQMYAQNRIDYQPALQTKLDKGTIVIAEDYTGTGIAWGVTKGAGLEDLEEQNKDLIKEDLAIWLEGDRFLEGKEEVHLHESSDSLMQRCGVVHAKLARRYGWKKVNANQSVELVSKDIWQIVKEVIN